MPLAEAFIDYYTAKLNIKPMRLSLKAKKHIQQYSWPGNIRQLKNVIFNSVNQSMDTLEIQTNNLSLPSYNKDFGYLDDEFEWDIRWSHQAV